MTVDFNKYMNFVDEVTSDASKDADYFTESCEIIEEHTTEDQVVYDPFMGSGTTAVGCMETNRKYIGNEIDKETFDLCNERLGTNYDSRL